MVQLATVVLAGLDAMDVLAAVELGSHRKRSERIRAAVGVLAAGGPGQAR